MNNARSRGGTIGLDIGARYIEICRRNAAGRTTLVKLRRTGAPPSPDHQEHHGDEFALSERDAQRIADVLERRAWTDTPITLSPPDEACLLGSVPVPPANSGAPIDRIAAAELMRMHRQDAARYAIAHWNIEALVDRGSGAQAMVQACERAVIDATIDRLDHVRVTVNAVESGVVALARAVAAEGCLAVIDAGHTASRVVLIVNGRPEYAAQLPWASGAELDRRLQKTAGRCVDLHLLEDAYAARPNAAMPPTVASVIAAFGAELGEAVGNALISIEDALGQTLSTTLLTGGLAQLEGVARGIEAALSGPDAPPLRCTPGLLATGLALREAA